MKCCVSGCRNNSNFKFPSNTKLKREWLKSIRRPNFTPKGNHGLCSDHFTKGDMVNESFYTGCKNERRRLCKKAIPSIFAWNTNFTKQNDINFDNAKNMVIIKEEIDIISDDKEELDSSISDINNYDSHFEDSAYSEQLFAAPNSQLDNDSNLCDVSHDYEYIEILNNTNIKLYEEIVVTSTNDNDQNIDIFGTSQNESICKDNSINEKYDHSYATRDNRALQENNKSQYSIENFKVDSEGILLFTGLQNYNKFMAVFHSLGHKTYSLRFKDNKCIENLTAENQLFLTLWKLRKNCTDCELSRHFGVSELAVANIFKTWIIFMAKQWSKLDIWPSKELVKYCMPENFKRYFPDTTVIIDGTKFHVQRPNQDSSFTYCQNNSNSKNIVKEANLNSNHQVMKQSSLQDKSVLQDIFGSNGVTILTPHSKKGQGNLLHILMKDQKISINSDQIQNIVRHLKFYKILSTKLCGGYLPLASKIVEICIMLCHFIEKM